jgi:hypothetical protein
LIEQSSGSGADKDLGQAGEVEMIVNLWNGEQKILSESLVFDVTSFIGEIGGYVGLLLGYSLLSLFDSMYGYANDIYDLCIKKQKKRMTKVSDKHHRRGAGGGGSARSILSMNIVRPGSNMTLKESVYNDASAYQTDFM